MNKTKLIFSHELSAMLKRKGIIIMTLVVPILALLALGAYKLAITGTGKSGVMLTKIGYIDQTGGFTKYLNQAGVTFTPFDNPGDATEALTKGNIAEYFVILSNYLQTGTVDRYTMKNNLSSAPYAAQTAKFLVDNLLSENETQTVIDRVNSPVNYSTFILDKSGSVSSDKGGLGNFIFLAAFAFLFALSMIFSSTYMLQGLSGEKENRLIEILLSSVSTRQLLIGKILGITTAGLIQVFVWVASIPLIFKLAENVLGSSFSTVIHLPVGYLALGTVYFILGYLMFAVLATSIGAIASSVQEAQQLLGLYSVFALIPLWGMSLVIAYPDSPVWRVFTIFPLSSPVLVMVRLGVSSIAAWEIVLSILVLIVCIIGGLALSDKIFRVYLLMYGKRPGLRQIISSLGKY